MSEKLADPYEVFDKHRGMIELVVNQLKDDRRLGNSLVTQIITKLHGPIETDLIHPQRLGGNFTDNHIRMIQSAITGKYPDEKTLWKTDIYSRDVPDTKTVSFIMSDTEHRHQENFIDGRDPFQLELITDGKKLQLQMCGPLELMSPMPDTERPSWRLPRGAFSERQERLIEKARKEAIDEGTISMRINCSVPDISDQQPEDPLRPEVEIIYIRTKFDIKRLPPAKRWQSIRLHDDGTETIEADGPANDMPRLYRPKFTKPNDHLLNQNTLELMGK